MRKTSLWLRVKIRIPQIWWNPAKLASIKALVQDVLRNGTFSSRKYRPKRLIWPLHNQIFVTKTSEHVPSNLLTLLTLDKIPRRRAAGDVFDIQN